jgi:predicted AAA+ superfamily ATPase
MKYIDRKIEAGIIKTAKTMPIIGITGPRQSGKTTLARRCAMGISI